MTEKEITSPEESSETTSPRKENQSAPYTNPYLAGVGLGVVILFAFYIADRGFGASRAMMWCVVSAQKTVAPSHVEANSYLAKYGGGDKKPLSNWLVFEVLGVLLGGLTSGALAGRIKGETNHGPQVTVRPRWVFANAVENTTDLEV